MKLLNKVAIITGAGRGIGKAIALSYAREGANLVVVSRTKSEIEETALEIKKIGRRVRFLSLDISKPSDVSLMVEKALDEFHRINILVNNAGIYGPIGPVVENDISRWIKAININLIGTFLCSREILPTMMKHNNGKIINLSGGGASSPYPRFSAYATSKAAVVRFTETLAKEVEEYNIQVNAIAPGAIYTRLHENVLDPLVNAGEVARSAAIKLKKTGGTSIELPAGLAVFLASDDSNGLTGRLISAVWDDWRNMNSQKIIDINSTDLYTIRRIDNNFFTQNK